MSTLISLFRGSLLSPERLLQAIEYYRPSKASPASEPDFAHWTHRVAVQAELGSARELAGLADDALSGLEAAFERNPVRRRTDRMRHAVPIGAVLAGAGLVNLALQGFGAGGPGSFSVTQIIHMACLVSGLAILAVGILSAFSAMHMDLSHGTTGLYVGTLDEQHPWLYRAADLAQNPAVDEYRRRVICERGALRGLDYIMMREIGRAEAALLHTRTARSVSEQLQSRSPVHEGRSAERRLVRVASIGESRALTDHHEQPQQPAAAAVGFKAVT